MKNKATLSAEKRGASWRASTQASLVVMDVWQVSQSEKPIQKVLREHVLLVFIKYEVSSNVKSPRRAKSSRESVYTLQENLFIEEIMFTIKVQLTQRQIADNAMRSLGISPAKLALKPGTRVEVNRKNQAKKGYVKHKNRAYSFSD